MDNFKSFCVTLGKLKNILKELNSKSQDKFKIPEFYQNSQVHCIISSCIHGYIVGTFPLQFTAIQTPIKLDDAQFPARPKNGRKVGK